MSLFRGVADMKRAGISDTLTMPDGQRINYVEMAKKMGIVPELEQNVPLQQQTLRTQWALLVLSAMVKNAEGDTIDSDLLRRMLNSTLDVFPAKPGA
jgi:hypothetical protein